MNSAPNSNEADGGAPGQGAGIVARFQGTSNPRYLRAIRALLRAPVMREQLDDITECSNSPDVVHELRALGLNLPCRRMVVVDRDGHERRPGQYSLDAEDRAKLQQWMRERTQGALGDAEQ